MTDTTYLKHMFLTDFVSHSFIRGLWSPADVGANSAFSPRVLVFSVPTSPCQEPGLQSRDQCKEADEPRDLGGRGPVDSGRISWLAGGFPDPLGPATETTWLKWRLSVLFGGQKGKIRCCELGSDSSGQALPPPLWLPRLPTAWGLWCRAHLASQGIPAWCLPALDWSPSYSCMMSF